MTRICAAADIGSNTAHLLVGATDGELVMRIDNASEWIPLGEVVARTGGVPKEHIEELVAAIREFKRVAQSKAADGLYVFATEAMRTASNHREVLKRIKSETGVSVDVIPPRREAELSYHGVLLDTAAGKPNLLFEVGGGSAQIASMGTRRMKGEASLPLGTGRIIAESGITNPCTKKARQAAEKYIDQALGKCNVEVAQPVCVASGGVARGLWRALHPDGEKRLAREELEYLAWATMGLSTARIIERFNVKNKRAGTLLPGSLIYLALMRRYGIGEMLISEFGVREGAILEMARGNIKVGKL